MIGPYVIDRQGVVYAVSPKAMEGRLSAAARNLTDPAGKAFIYDMEGLLYELDMKTHEPTLVVARAAPGWHGKGMYSGQGVVVVANNGEHAAGLGRPAGTGYVWRGDAVSPDLPSDPMLLAGGTDYGHRVVHLAHESDATVTFTLEAGTGATWKPIAKVPVPANGYAFHVLPRDVDGDWVRVRSDRVATKVTALFQYGTRGGLTEDQRLFSALADVGSTEPWIGAVMRSGDGDSLPLDVLASEVDGTGRVAADRAWEVAVGRAPVARASDDPVAKMLREKAVPQSPDVSFDAASVILTEGSRRFRLPKPLDPQAAAAYEKAFATGWPRGLREVATERSLLNAAGTFYVLPRVSSGGAAKILPVCSHGKRITDFCSWRGLLVLGGVRQKAAALARNTTTTTSRVIGSTDETGMTSLGAAVWAGDIDELWRLPRPTGRGGPWHETAVEPGVPSDPYLMGGYDEKMLELSHVGVGAVRMIVEIDPAGDGTWFEYATLDVPAGKTVEHRFPSGFLAQWVRLRADTACQASALLTYR